jgi:protein-S-isoprenylcysteine O-methyltransferase Ste14
MPMPPAETGWGSARQFVRMAASPVLWVAVLFSAAGRLNWTRGWICVALYAAGMSAIGLAVRRCNAPLMEARAKWRREGTKRFDRIFLALLLPLVFLQPLVAGLDAVRFRWSTMSFGWLYAGVALFVPAVALIAWSLAVNRYAETSVRIQTGHTVVASGPYRAVRHPMYMGAILMYLATPLVLGSVWALAVAGILTTLFVWRTAMEDRTLRRELAGYEAYAARTRSRLLPGVW